MVYIQLFPPNLKRNSNSNFENQPVNYSQDFSTIQKRNFAYILPRAIVVGYGLLC
jgi:hypothetical protein